MSGEAAPKGHPGTTTSTSNRTPGPGRCRPCGGWISRRCVICAGQPEHGVTIGEIAGWVRSVDRAVDGYRRSLRRPGPRFTR